MPIRRLSATGNRLRTWNSLCGIPFKCFFDAHIRGYHHTNGKDEEKTTFIISQGIFCYTKMPFGLRNAGATYQCLVDKTFHKQIGRNLEVYVDDLVIKSRTEDEIVRDIKETFKMLREINMKLNPKKCTFGVEKGMFLGYKVNSKGLKVYPDKVEAVLSLSSPKCLKDVQKLNGKLASLNKFLAKSAEKSLPFFKTLKKCTKKSDFRWTTEVEEAFKQGNKANSWSSLCNGINGEWKRAIGIKRSGTKLHVDGKVGAGLMANQVNGTYVAKEADMIRYLEKVKALTGGFKAFTIKQIPRSENKKADALSKIASTSFAHLSKQVLVEELKEKSISEVEVLTVVEEERDTWMTPIYKYLAKETLPADMKKARPIRRKSWRFAVINGILYKKSFLGLWLRCVGLLQANYVLREIHEGSCSMHAVHKPNPRNPQQKLTPITSPWPFYKWGIDIAGPFSEGPGKVKFLIVAMDYFTKWIGAKPVATITGNQIKKFVWDNITNGLVERANRILGEGIKAMLKARSKNWMEELSHVLWAHRTMIKSSNGDTPFSLTYGTETVIPAEIGMPTIRITEVDLVQNNEALEINISFSNIGGRFSKPASARDC
ncbi:reverse transcriptase domain-containing protein [Tanacetum coccineum]